MTLLDLYAPIVAGQSAAGFRLGMSTLDIEPLLLGAVRSRHLPTPINCQLATGQTSVVTDTTASASFTAADERYRAGVGTIADLLSAQASLTNAKNRKLQALSDWRSAIATLWAKLGQIRKT